MAIPGLEFLLGIRRPLKVCCDKIATFLLHDRRANKRIKHCIIKEDGRLFTVGLNKFETLVDLVNFYEKHPFYNQVSLTLPVTDELIRRMGVVSLPYIISKSC